MASEEASPLIAGDGRYTSIKEITEIYRYGVSHSLPSSGSIINLEGNENYGLTCNFSATDCSTSELIKTSKSYSLVTCNTPDRHIKSIRCVSHPQLSVELAKVTSNDGRFLARLRADLEKKRQLLEIWERSRLLKTIDINEVEEHGPINVDEFFASMIWCPFGEQRKLLYICQAKNKKIPSFFKQKVRDDENPNLDDNNLRCEDWGECLNGIEHTLLGIIDAVDFKISTFDLKGYSLAKSRWLDENQVVSTAYQEEPRRLGVIYCNNRPSKLVVHELSGSSYDIAIKDQCLHNPRVSHSGKKMIYLVNAVFGAHQHSVSLHLFDCKSRSSEVLVNELFVQELPMNCFTQDDSGVLFVKRDYIHDRMCLLNLTTKQVHEINFPTNGPNILDFRYDIILASGSDVNVTPTLYVATLISPELVAWHQIEECVHLDEVNYQDYKIETHDGSSFVSALLISPSLRTLYRNFKLADTGKNESDLPTVVNVHGGPHGNYVVKYMHQLVFSARLGFKSLVINYRGSTGVDEAYVQSLCGKVGTLDVDDCLHVIRHLVKNKAIDPTKLIITGKSHGGFLASHLSCQDEFRFASAIIGNPVIDLSNLVSDIPDWVYTEGLGHDKFDFAWLPDAKELVKLFECSPMGKYRSANVPTLMLLGSNDRRVPMYQGLRWIDLLKARGIKTKCKIYEDKHDLAKPNVEADWMISAMIWMLQHLGNH